MIGSKAETGSGLNGIMKEETSGTTEKLNQNGGVKEEMKKIEVEAMEAAKA